MNKKLKVVASMLIASAILCGCGSTDSSVGDMSSVAGTTVKTTTVITTTAHHHEWTEATCDTPKTCKECGATEGDKLEHQWIEATCAAPKTCSLCGTTEGEKLEHIWVEATCTAPKTCSLCGTTEGKKLEHTWVEATCDKPKYCSVCNKTEGNPLGHNVNEKGYCSRCNKKMINSVEELEKYFNNNIAGTVVTPMGNVNVYEIRIRKGTHDYESYDYLIESEGGLESILISWDYRSSREYTAAQKQETLSILQNYQIKLADLAMGLFPDKKWAGCFKSDGYRYPNLKLDYYYEQDFTWCNYALEWLGDNPVHEWKWLATKYNETVHPSGFRWATDSDDSHWFKD